MIIPNPLPDNGIAVPVKAAFLVFKRWPLLGVASNNLNPILVLHQDHMEFSVLGRKRRAYSDIQDVDARQWIGAQSVIFHWRGAFFAYSANVGQAPVLVGLLEFFAGKGFNLTETAREVLSSNKKG